MLACLLAKEGNDLPVDAAVIVSAPFMLEACSYHMEGLFPRLSALLAEPVKANAARKLAAYPGTLPINLAQLNRYVASVNLTISSPPEFTATPTLSTIIVSVAPCRC